MLDSFTSSMCSEPWGRLGFARALIEVSANVDLKQVVTMAVPIIDGEGHTKERMNVEYEWKPPRCKECQVALQEQDYVFIQTTIGESSGNGGEANKFDSELEVVDSESEVEDMVLKHSTNDDTVQRASTLSQKGNDPKERRILWANLETHKNMVCDMSWVMLGDFNVALNLEDSFASSSGLNAAMCDFKDCIQNIEVIDINSSGLHFTWNQKPRSGGGILKKLDRVMGNLEFVDNFPGAYAFFHPYRISNHAHSVLKIPSLSVAKPKPFKFYNFIAHKKNFLEVISS
ncbi:RNA-directed DNA polymerase, eukaryota, reverse transcriptase zinc-binding domain protein [Tanacetum coccineum]